MAIAQAVCNSFKKELLEGGPEFQSGEDVFTLALYDSSANLSAATTAYPGDSTGGQVPDSGQYAQGGGALTGQQTSLDTGVAIVDFAELSFTGVTLTARGALIYNTSTVIKLLQFWISVVIKQLRLELSLFSFQRLTVQMLF